jgi:hypothetical protein
MWQRKTPRITKAGRRIGKSSLIRGATWTLDGADETAIRDYLNRPVRQTADEAITAIAANPFGASTTYGKLTGKCGCCNRKLTDPTSLLRGIGPECWDNLGKPAMTTTVPQPAVGAPPVLDGQLALPGLAESGSAA